MVRIPKVQFLFKQEGEKYQIYLYDDVNEFGDFNWETWTRDESETSAKYFQKKLSEIPDDAEIELFINSNGGSVKEGTSIYNQLKRHPAHKTGYVDGVAHSIAFVILQACDRRVMGEGTSALIHEMWVCTAGNAKQLRAEADQLDTLMEGSRKLFMQRAQNITEEQLKEMMEAETILTPDMAVKYGFADEIAGRNEDISNQPMQAAADIKAIREKLKPEQFETVLKEFQENIGAEQKEPEKKEPEQKEEKEAEASTMDAFFNAFL